MYRLRVNWDESVDADQWCLWWWEVFHAERMNLPLPSGLERLLKDCLCPIMITESEKTEIERWGSTRYGWDCQPIIMECIHE